MINEQLPVKSYRYKKTYINIMIAVICVIGFFLFIGLFIYTFRYLGRFEPLLHFSTLAVMVIYTLVVRFALFPPVYIWLDSDRLLVRRSFFGGWKVIDPSRITKAVISDDRELLILTTRQDDLPQVEIKLINLTENESEELKVLLLS